MVNYSLNQKVCIRAQQQLVKPEACRPVRGAASAKMLRPGHLHGARFPALTCADAIELVTWWARFWMDVHHGDTSHPTTAHGREKVAPPHRKPECGAGHAGYP